MCVKTAIKSSTLCLIPGMTGFGGGLLSVAAPKVFAWTLLLSIVGAGLFALRKAAAAGSGKKAFECEEVEVAAGCLLALSFVFGLWTGLAYAAGFGLLAPGLVVWFSTALLAAFCLTFVRRLIAREVKWVDRLVLAVLPKTDDDSIDVIARRRT